MKTFKEHLQEELLEESDIINIGAMILSGVGITFAAKATSEGGYKKWMKRLAKEKRLKNIVKDVIASPEFVIQKDAIKNLSWFEGLEKIRSIADKYISPADKNYLANISLKVMKQERS